jgi:2-methylcitrate dehydratase PrpD
MSRVVSRMASAEPGARSTLVSRRDLFRHAGWLIAAGVIPRRVSADSVSPATTTLSTYSSEARNRALPPDVLAKARLHTLDTLAAMVSGSELAGGRAAIPFARAYGGAATATVVASSVVCGAIEAALVNGVLAHADETDDSHDAVRWHPGCAVVPAALAAGEQFGISGMHLLRAVALGYDVGSRVMATLIAAGPQTHKSTHSIAGIWGAAAAAGCAASLTPQQMRWLFDYTAQQASGIGVWARDADHIEKGFAFGGMPARGGVTAALLVKSGWTGVDDVFSGEDNYILANAQGADPARLPTELLVEKLGERYELMRTNIKKWSVGSPIQAPLDALEAMLKKRPFDASQVRSVTVRIESSARYTGTAGAAAVVNDRDMPDVNLQHMLAIMLLDKSATFEAAHDRRRMSDPAVLRERAKITLTSGDDRPAAGRQPLLRVTLADGSALTEDVRDVRGTIRNPMTADEVVAKCRALLTPVLGGAASARLIDRVLSLEAAASVRELRPFLQHGSSVPEP